MSCSFLLAELNHATPRTRENSTVNTNRRVVWGAGGLAMVLIIKTDLLSVVDYSCYVTCKLWAEIIQLANLDTSCHREDR